MPRAQAAGPTARSAGHTTAKMFTEITRLVHVDVLRDMRLLAYLYVRHREDVASLHGKHAGPRPHGTTPQGTTAGGGVAAGHRLAARYNSVAVREG